MNKKITILGAGESGIGAALLAQQKGYTVWVSDKGQISPSRKEIMAKEGIGFEEGQHTESKVLDADEIIKSPGIPFSVPMVKLAIEKGIPVIDELEFAYRYSKGKVIGITGTNGKTTTTLLTYHLLKKGGIKVGLAGNVGQSWAGQLVHGDKDWWVIEMSSFQIDGFKSLKPHIGLLTNITPDHLDRYDYKIENYVASKFSLFDRMESEDAAIYFAEDLLTQEGLRKFPLKGTQYPVSLESSSSKGGYFDGLNLQMRVKGKKLEVSEKDIILKGRHNLLNSMMASLVGMLTGVGEAEIREGLADFKNAAHRMELVDTLNGVAFVNDSKGTNVDATIYALESYASPIIWIAGGVDKGNDYASIDDEITAKVKLLICLGKDNSKLKEAFHGRIQEILETQDMVQAVNWGLKNGKNGDVVLLSPACASFDLFKNYEDRGNQFKAAVSELKMGQA
jgi:UDP-N-acetylmuramoylalanine--D-glutamate ligase